MADTTWKIVSGEGEQGTVEPYTGKLTLRAMRARITRERRGGRWAHYLDPDGERITYHEIKDALRFYNETRTATVTDAALSFLGRCAL